MRPDGFAKCMPLLSRPYVINPSKISLKGVITFKFAFPARISFDIKGRITQWPGIRAILMRTWDFQIQIPPWLDLFSVPLNPIAPSFVICELVASFLLGSITFPHNRQSPNFK